MYEQHCARVSPLPFRLDGAYSVHSHPGHKRVEWPKEATNVHGPWACMVHVLHMNRSGLLCRRTPLYAVSLGLREAQCSRAREQCKTPSCQGKTGYKKDTSITRARIDV